MSPLVLVTGFYLFWTWYVMINVSLVIYFTLPIPCYPDLLISMTKWIILLHCVGVYIYPHFFLPILKQIITGPRGAQLYSVLSLTFHDLTQELLTEGGTCRFAASSSYGNSLVLCANNKSTYHCFCPDEVALHERYFLLIHSWRLNPRSC